MPGDYVHNPRSDSTPLQEFSSCGQLYESSEAYFLWPPSNQLNDTTKERATYFGEIQKELDLETLEKIPSRHQAITLLELRAIQSFHRKILCRYSFGIATSFRIRQGVLPNIPIILMFVARTVHKQWFLNVQRLPCVLEMPALQRFLRQRVHLHQWPGVQITSSTILTSTFHVTRLNARSGNLIGGFGTHHVRNNQPEESNMTGSGVVSQSIWTYLDGARVCSGLHRNFQGGDEFLSLHSTDNDHVIRAHAGSADTTDPNYRTTTTRGVNTYSIRTSSNAMQYNELRENNTYSGLDQQAIGIDLLQTTQATASMMNPNSLMSFSSLLLWILGGPPDGLDSLPMFRDTGDQQLANNDFYDQENQQNIQSSWWRGSSGLEGLRQRSGHSLETCNKSIW